MEGIMTRRMINRKIEQAYRRVMDKTVDRLLSYYQKNGGLESDFSNEFQIIHRAGDDINIVCNANLAFPFLDFFYDYLKDTIIWESEEMKIPLYVYADKVTGNRVELYGKSLFDKEMPYECHFFDEDLEYRVIKR